MKRLSAYTAILSVAALTMVFCQSAESAKAKTSTQKAETVAETKPSPDSAKPAETKPVSDKLIVYYFHTTFRCPSCNKIQALTKQAVESGFADEIKSGRVEFKAINIEEKGNEHLVEDYKLYTKSVILSEMAGADEKSWKNLDKVWTLLRDDAKFIAYVKNEISDLLKG